jgi:hypothetical protein
LKKVAQTAPAPPSGIEVVSQPRPVSAREAAKILEIDDATFRRLEGKPGVPLPIAASSPPRFLDTHLAELRFKVRNGAQLAIAKHLAGGDHARASEILMQRSIGFADRWASSRSFRDACYLAFPFAGSVEGLVALLNAG